MTEHTAPTVTLRRADISDRAVVAHIAHPLLGVLDLNVYPTSPLALLAEVEDLLATLGLAPTGGWHTDPALAEVISAELVDID